MSGRPVGQVKKMKLVGFTFDARREVQNVDFYDLISWARRGQREFDGAA